MSYTVKTYTAAFKQEWDQFVSQSKNATFLFQRDFMEYHSDRFKDHSMLLYKDEKLVALVPANIADQVLYSHQGLTYGGILLSKRLKMEDTIGVCRALFQYLFEQGISKFILKTIPAFYTSYPSEEIDYLLFLTQAKLLRVDVSSVIAREERIRIQGNRLEGVKKAAKMGLEVREEANFTAFWDEILVPNLLDRHGASPTHAKEEIELLAGRFPKNIHQFNVYHEGKIVAGATLFETSVAVHVQYISANKDRQQLGSLDLLFQFLIEERFPNKRYFDFGISNENNGLNLNRGLLYWKETFGARTMSCKFYEVNTKYYTYLDTVFL
ncbi:MAG: GNAT family N-acetyltransferase [Bacteroidota bacterium]